MKNMAITTEDLDQKFESVVNRYGKNEIFKYALINAYFNLFEGYEYAGDPCTIDSLVCVDEIGLTEASKICGLEFLSEPWPDSCIVNDAFDCSEISLLLFRAVQVATIVNGDYDELNFFNSVSPNAANNMVEIIKVLASMPYLINGLNNHAYNNLDKKDMLELYVDEDLLNNIE